MKTHHPVIGWVALLFSAAVLVGCGSSETSEPDTQTGDTAEEDAGDDTAVDGAADVDAADTTEDVTSSDADDGSSDGTDAPDTSDVEPDTGLEGSVGCVDGSGLPEGENTFMLSGRERRFIVRLPNGYAGDRPWPLVLALHGNGGSAEYWDGTDGDRDIRSVLQDNAILVIAEAIDGNWRDYEADPATWPDRIEEELLYFDEILTQARNELCIEEDAIFSMGFSGGGSFSGVLGCRRTDIRAIAVGGSVIYFDEANCVGTPAAWITIGTQELSSGRLAYRDFFRDRAGCRASTVPAEPDPCVAYEGCGDGTPVHYCQHPDGHIWPDFGSEAMWDFFSQFVKTP